MNEDYDYPCQEDHFHGLEEEILSDEANRLVPCDKCGQLIHPCNAIEGFCEDCWDDYDPYDYEDEAYYPDEDGMSDVEADADTLASAGYGTDEDYGYFGGDEDY